MKQVFVTFCILSLILITGLFAQDFMRGTSIAGPETDLNNGGWGNMISGVDVDGDGLLEIYLVNDNWNDGATEVIPRIYKLEQNGDSWDVVWSAVAPVEYQNTWPQLALADLDKDGKTEIIWTPINAGSGNPFRVLVYEQADGDAFGIATDEKNASSGEDLKYAPNSAWTIAETDGENIRPMDMSIGDPDNDGVDELLIADRAGNTSGYYFIVCSVDDIPDNGDGSESWEIETSGIDFGDLTAQPIENKWDVAQLGSNLYFFCEVEVSKVSWDGASWGYTPLSPMPGGAFVQSSEAVDLDKDGTSEIIGAVYDWGDDAHKAIMLLQESGDSLKQTELINVSDYWPSGSRGPWGHAVGDIDNDGYLDFVYGSRDATPNAAIFRVAYRGGDITDPANYEFSVIDSNAADGGVWSILNLANIDDDPELEVLYTASTNTGGLGGGTPPIFVLDYTGETGVTFDKLVIAPEVQYNGAAPEGFAFKPGRILDENTIWFAGWTGSLAGNETYGFRSVDGGETFTHNATAITGRVAQMDAFDENTAIIATAEGYIYRTADGGATWDSVYSYTDDGWFDGCRVLNENVAVAFGDGPANGEMHFVRTDDKGATWTRIEGIDYMNAAYAYYTWGLAACTVGENIWCSATTVDYDASFVFRSTDAGLTWDSFEIPVAVIPNYPRAIAFSDANNGMIAARGGYVIKTTDGGETWSATDNPDTTSGSNSYVNGVVAIPGTNIIMGMDDIGAYYTTNLGASWGQLDTPAETDADYFTSGVFLNPDFGFAFTDGGLVLRFENQVTDIIDPFTGKLPDDFQLLQNFPNPFNPTTQIVFSMPKAADVSLVIYDMLGRKVRTLITGNQSVGTHSVTWDGLNDNGSRVASGSYIYRLSGNDFSISKRMQLVR
jgi:photosystem II stability/assembly factor-like uncharacterized protein